MFFYVNEPCLKHFRIISLLDFYIIQPFFTQDVYSMQAFFQFVLVLRVLYSYTRSTNS
jgi:hypothetical protein